MQYAAAPLGLPKCGATKIFLQEGKSLFKLYTTISTNYIQYAYIYSMHKLAMQYTLSSWTNIFEISSGEIEGTGTPNH